MELKRLSLTNFKNIASAQLEFSSKINGFLGNNGMGKSNLLDAVYTLSLTKSFSGVPDRMLIMRGEDFSIVKGEYTRRGVEEDLLMGARNRTAQEPETTRKGISAPEQPHRGIPACDGRASGHRPYPR